MQASVLVDTLSSLHQVDKMGPCCPVLGARTQTIAQAQKEAHPFRPNELRPRSLPQLSLSLVITSKHLHRHFHSHLDLTSSASADSIRPSPFLCASTMATVMQKIKDIEDEVLFFSTISNPSSISHSWLVSERIRERKIHIFRESCYY